MVRGTRLEILVVHGTHIHCAIQIQLQCLLLIDQGIAVVAHIHIPVASLFSHYHGRILRRIDQGMGASLRYQKVAIIPTDNVVKSTT